jgi:hypothetical protein
MARLVACTLSLQNKTILKGEPILDSVNENRFSCEELFTLINKKKLTANTLANNILFFIIDWQ